MASIWTRRAQNLPAQQTETTALETLLREDLEYKSLIEKRQETLQRRISEAEGAAKAFSECINATDEFRGVYAANSLSYNAFKERITRVLEVHYCYFNVLTAIPSAGELLATWSDILRLSDEVSACIEKARLQAELHLHLCAVEQVAHESVGVAAKYSLQAVGRELKYLRIPISQKRKKIYSIRCLPAELLQQIFNMLVEEKQAFLNGRLNSFPASPKAYYADPGGMWRTINFVPIILSATCKRWQGICESTPSLWRFLRIPTTMHPDFNPWVIGMLPFARNISNTNGRNLEITLYPSLLPETVTQALSSIPSDHSIAQLNIVGNAKIPSTLSSALSVMFVGHSGGPEVKTVDLVPKRLQKAQHVSCNERLPLIPDGPLRLHSLHISLNKACVFPDIGRLLIGLPVLQTLELWFHGGVTHQASTACTHHSLHTISASSCALPILQLSIRDGVSIPAFRHFRLLDVDNTFAYLNVDNNAAIFALVTHLTIRAVSSSRGSVKIRALLDGMTALLVLQLKGTAVRPGLDALSIEPPIRIHKLALSDSTAECAPLHEYVTKVADVSQVGDDASSVRIIWEGCPKFSQYYGTASGNLFFEVNRGDA